MQHKFNRRFTLYCIYLYKFDWEQYMRALLMCFLASVSVQYGYLYAVNTDDVDVEEVEDEEDDGEHDEDDDENDDVKDEKIDKKSQTVQNVKLKIANKNTALSANLNNVEQAKLGQKEEEKRKALEAKKAKEQQCRFHTL